jgi:BirA family transcriptional regulator, biotin operon repressor / biotin---[acetyl-CoA-carboxylase] ligase
LFKNFSDTRRIGKQLIYLPKCHSTNDIAAELIHKQNVADGTIIITDHQTAGRGQRGNKWESEKGLNLTFSIILFPGFLKAEDNFFLNIVITLGLLDVLSAHGTSQFKIKWPNDIYFINRKLGGILIENAVQSGFLVNAVAGIGINVNQRSFNTTRAVSLAGITLNDFDRGDLFNQIVRSIDNRYIQLVDNQRKELREAYLSGLYRFNQPGRYKSDIEFTGVITGIDEFGRLLVKSDGEIKSYDLKEIEFLDE